MGTSWHMQEVAHLLNDERQVEPRGCGDERVATDLLTDVTWLLSSNAVRTLRMIMQDQDDFVWLTATPTFAVRVEHVGTATIPTQNTAWSLLRFVHVNDMRLFPYLHHWELAIPDQLSLWIASDGSCVRQQKTILSHSFRIFLLEAIQAQRHIM